MKLSRTVALIKPDGVRLGLIGEILKMAQDRGLYPVDLKLFEFTTTGVAVLYAEHIGKDFFPAHVEFMTSGPSVAVLFQFEGDAADAIPVWRELMGPTDPVQARAQEEECHGCIRSRWGTHLPQNVVHGSDSREAVGREARFLGRYVLRAVPSRS